MQDSSAQPAMAPETKGFFNPTQAHWCDCREVTGLLPSGVSRVMLFSGRSSRAMAETIAKGVEHLGNTIAPAISEDPTADSVQEVTEQVREFSPDWIIAIGGGSVLDSVKAAAVLAKHEGRVTDYMRGDRKITHAGIPVSVIPTTAGSGSEITPFSSITDVEMKKKQSLAHEYLYPTHAVLDPSLTLSLPPRQTAISGMDALSHSIEGYWSKHSSPVTDEYALSAAKLILKSLASACNSGGEIGPRSRMLEGSYLAGRTISNAMTTAAHAVSYPMTVHFGIPHGLACSMLLPAVVRYNAGSMDPAKEDRLLGHLGFSTMDRLAEAIEDLKDETGLPNRLRDLDLGPEQVKVIVENGFRPDRMNNNPREITVSDLTELLTALI
jgi:alcohol dehydrogenase